MDMSFLTKFVYKPLSLIYKNDNDIYLFGFTSGVSSVAVLYYYHLTLLNPAKQFPTCMVAVVAGGGLLLLAAMKYLNYKNEIDVQENTIKEHNIQSESLNVTEVASGGFKELAVIKDKFQEIEKEVHDRQNEVFGEYDILNKSIKRASATRSKEFEREMIEIETEAIKRKMKLISANKLIPEHHHALRNLFIVHVKDRSCPFEQPIDTIQTKLINLKNEMLGVHNGVTQTSASLRDLLQDLTKTKRRRFKKQITAIQNDVLNMENKLNIEQVAMIQTYRCKKEELRENTVMTIELFRKELAEIQSARFDLESETKHAQRRLIEAHRIQSESFLDVNTTTFSEFKEEITAIQNQLLKLRQEMIYPQLVGILYATSNNVTETISELKERIAVLQNFSILKKKNNKLNKVYKESKTLVESVDDFLNMIGKGFKEQNAVIEKAISHVTDFINITTVIFADSLILIEKLNRLNDAEYDEVEKSDEELLNKVCYCVSSLPRQTIECENVLIFLFIIFKWLFFIHQFSSNF